MFDYSKLLGRIKEKGFSQYDFAGKLGLSPATMSLKLSNQAYFKQIEIEKACDLLGIQSFEIGDYFFCLKSSEK